jgi:hypothetical protein
MPLRFTELHHLSWWKRDEGKTDLANCAPYCSYHHHELHSLDLRVRRLANGSYEHRRPNGRLYGGYPGTPYGGAPPRRTLIGLTPPDTCIGWHYGRTGPIDDESIDGEVFKGEVCGGGNGSGGEGSPPDGWAGPGAGLCYATADDPPGSLFEMPA